MSARVWGILRWFATSCFILSTTMMLSQYAASTLVTPWILYIVGNIIWGAWAHKVRDWALFTLCFFYTSLDILITLTRIGGFHFFDYIQPLLHLLDKLP